MLLDNISNIEELKKIKEKVKVDDNAKKHQFEKISKLLTLRGWKLKREKLSHRKEQIFLKLENDKVFLVMHDGKLNNPFTDKEQKQLVKLYKNKRVELLNIFSKKSLTLSEKIKVTFGEWLNKSKKFINNLFSNGNNNKNDETVEDKPPLIIRTVKNIKAKIPKSFKKRKTKEKSLLVWDVENIYLHKYIDIFNKLGYHPEKIFTVAKYELNESNSNIAKKINATHISGHIDSDDRIREILKEQRKNYKEAIIVSSDAGFLKIAQYLINAKKEVKFIATNHNKKRLIMKGNLSDNKLNFLIL